MQHLKRQLRSYQLAAQRKFAKKDCAFFAMEMRLGKTLACIRWLNLKKAEKILVIAPKTVLFSWEQELKEEREDFINLADGTLLDRVIDLYQYSPRFSLINYESVNKLERAIRFAEFDSLVCDESFKIKNPRAGTTKSIISLGKGAKYRAALSGLPTPNSWMDIFTQMQFVHAGSWMGFSNFYAWRQRLFSAQGYQHYLSNASKTKIKEAFHASAFALSRKEAGFSGEPVIQDRQGELPSKASKIYQHIFKHWEYPDESRDTKTILTAIQWMQRVCGGYLKDFGLIDTWKVKEVESILNDETPKDGSVVIWCAFNEEIDRLAEAIGDCLVMTGKTKNNKQTQKDFQAGKKRVIIVQQALGKYGIRLDRADTAIYYSSSFDYDQYAQSRDRILDVRKKFPLLVINLITKNTVEQDIYALLKSKRQNSKELLIQKVQASAKRLGYNGPWNAGARSSLLERKIARRERNNSRKRQRLVIKS